MSDMERDSREYERQDWRRPSLIAINVYPERVAGEAVVWLVISRQDGAYSAMTFAPADVDLLIGALTQARRQLDQFPPLEAAL